MANLPTTEIQQASSGIDGFYFFLMLVGLMVVTGYFLVSYIIQRWFGNGMIIAKDAWQKGMAIIQHFETGKDAKLKLARVEGDAFRHQQVRDGTLAAMPKGVNLLGSKQWVLTWALFGASISADLLAGIATLKNMGYNNLEDVMAEINKTDKKIDNEINSGNSNTEPFDGDTVILKGYDFDNVDNLLFQSSKRTLIPLSIEDVPKFIKKSINPHDTEYVVGLEVENEIGDVKDSSTSYFFLCGIFIFMASLGFMIIWNAITSPKVT